MVTGQLLSFSRRAFHEPKVIDLGAAVRESEPLVRRLLGESRHLALAVKASPQVRIDPRQLDQVIVNLALNARDAMPVDGTLTMTEEVELKEGVAMADGASIPAERYGVPVMRDTGVGMDAATQARIFEPFFTTKPTGEGSGLGLAASYGIVKQNDGYIAVTSAPARVRRSRSTCPSSLTPVPASAGHQRGQSPGRPDLREQPCCWWRTNPTCGRSPPGS